MRFSFLLYLLFLKIKKAQKQAAFQALIRDKDFTMAIKTRDGKRGRTFTFKNGSVVSNQISMDQADAAMVWADASIAFNTMKQGSDEATMTAMGEGNLVFEGDVNLAMEFGNILKNGLSPDTA